MARPRSHSLSTRMSDEFDGNVTVTRRNDWWCIKHEHTPEVTVIGKDFRETVFRAQEIFDVFILTGDAVA